MAALTITLQRPARFDEPIMSQKMYLPAKACSRCGTVCGQSGLCGQCFNHLHVIADSLAVASSGGWKNAKFSFDDGTGVWRLQVGAPESWGSADPVKCILSGVTYIAGRAEEFGQRVVRAARVGRTDSTSQKEYDRIQDIVSRAIEALGVELKYA